MEASTIQEDGDMETCGIPKALRERQGLTQEELAQRLFVTRQAVSRWETGETVPNVETLKLLSRLYEVSINTLLGSPQQLICQCCGMPLDDSTLSREPDGAFNKDYCKWCYADGRFAYESVEQLTDFLAAHMASPERSPEQLRAYFADFLPTLGHWKKG